MSEIGSSDIKSVLDYGCGPGEVAGFYSQMGKAVDAVDVSKEMVDITSRRFPNVHAFVCDSEGKADEYKSEYDVVVASLVLHHVHNA